MPTHTQTPPAPRAARPLLTAILLGAGLLVLAASATAVPNNAGTVKVHNPGELGTEDNDPHVGCSFFVEGSNMEAGNGTLVIQSWPPTGNMTVVLDVTWTSTGNETQANQFVNGPYELDAGHYKLFASDGQHDKQKVFWVDCAETLPPCEETDTCPTDIPVFPTGLSLMLGLLGALGAAFGIFLRKA